jgi:hypothetical protein
MKRFDGRYWAIAAGAFLVAQLAGDIQHTHRECEPGFVAKEVRIQGQHFSEGEMVWNYPPSDTQYVVARLCVRPMTAQEWNDYFDERSHRTKSAH